MTQHYFSYLKKLKDELGKINTAKFNELNGEFKKTVDQWLEDPLSTSKYKLVNDVAKIEKLLPLLLNSSPLYDPLYELDSKLTTFRSLKLWVYDLEGYSDDVFRAYKNASRLCAIASHALLTKPAGIKEILDSYFGSGFDITWDGPRLAGQYTSVMSALMNKFIVFAPGEKGKTGRDTIAYVQERDDDMALQQTTFFSGLKDRYGIIKVNEKFLQGGTVPQSGISSDSVQNQMNTGVTVLHELTHLFAKSKTEDYSVDKITPENIKAYNIPVSTLKECYGRAACKALGASNPFLAMGNADTLALLALDIYLVHTKVMDVKEVARLGDKQKG